MNTSQELRDEVVQILSDLWVYPIGEERAITFDEARDKLLALITQALHRQDVESRLNELNALKDKFEWGNGTDNIDDRIKELTDSVEKKPE